jgi:hypothetical protein
MRTPIPASLPPFAKLNPLLSFPPIFLFQQTKRSLSSVADVLVTASAGAGASAQHHPRHKASRHNAQ